MVCFSEFKEASSILRLYVVIRNWKENPMFCYGHSVNEIPNEHSWVNNLTSVKK